MSATPAERAAADELTALTEEMGLYDATIGTASGGSVHGQTTAEGPHRSETTAVDASPELAEPTDVDIRAGLEIASLVRNTSQTLAGRVEGARAIAAALAAEREAIHARYEAVAAACDEDAVTPDPSESLTWAAAAARIRQVAAQ